MKDEHSAEAAERAAVKNWPKERACIPDTSHPGTRIVGFRIREGDEAWGTHGLSEPLFWLERMCTLSPAESEPEQEAVARPKTDVRALIADIEAGRADGFLNDGTEQDTTLACPYCGGSGHRDDVGSATLSPAESEPEQEAVKPKRIGVIAHVDHGRTSLTAAVARLSRPPSERAVTEAMRLREAASRIVPYLKWTIGEESPGHHPTMPSAVGAFMSAFGWPTDEAWQAYLRASLTAAMEAKR